MDPRLTTAARYHQQKNFPAAEQIYRQILLTEPRNVDALLLLGLLLHDTKRNEESVETLRRALKIQPQRAEVRQTLVGPLSALGRLKEAAVEAREVARLRPLGPDAHFAAGQLLVQCKEPTAALPYLKRAAELQPKSAAIQLLIGRAYHQLNQIGDAITAMDRALAIDPKFPDALIDKGLLRQSQGQIDDAISLYEAGLKVSPNNVAALNNLGGCYLIKMRNSDALRCFEIAAQAAPNDPRPRSNIGAVLKDSGRIDDAIGQFKHALQIDPTYADAWCNIGASYAAIGEHQLSIDATRQALRLQPDYAEVASNLLLTLLSPTDVSREAIFAEHTAWGASHSAILSGQMPPAPIDPAPNRKIRIGYLSPDFREHSVRYFIEPVLGAHDRSQFEIFCYAAGRRRDDVTDRLATLVDSFNFVAELNNRQLAELIRSHQIDILVELAGHTSDHRLLVCAYKPAPVQVTYLGYPTTTGMREMDFRLTDSICDPPGTDAFYTERLVRLPNAFFVYEDDPVAPFDPALPADRNGVFTFGSFNSFTKMNDQTLDSWAAILQAVPNSRLLMKARPLDNPGTRQRVTDFFADHGVTADRLDLRAWVSLSEHTNMLASGIDLMLDTFPYNGHTTSCQAIWRGVPMVTRSGDSFRSRVGECILHHLGLPDFVARSREEYEKIAIALANDLKRLRELRPTLRQRMQASPLCDAGNFARSLEDAYRRMLRTTAANRTVDRGLEFHQRGEFTEAGECYEAALKIDPENLPALNNLGACQLEMDRADDAIGVLKKAAELSPNEPRPRSNIGNALDDLGRFDEAIEQYKAAYAIDPTFAEALHNMAGAYASMGRAEDAMASYRSAMQVNPGFAMSHSSLLLQMLWATGVSEQEILDESLQWERIHARPLYKPVDLSRVDFNPNRRLRIGYVSADFCEHSVRHFMEPVLASHDHQMFDVFCFSTSKKNDAVTQRLKKIAGHWHDAAELNDEQLANLIRSERIDVLIDLSGHTGGNRLPSFARSPAPVQVTYLGYPATTGISAIQYRLTDPVADPIGQESLGVESLVRLPNAFFVYNGDESLPYDPTLPADRNGFVTFGSFNALPKLNPPMLSNWVQILHAVPNSRLILKAKPMGDTNTRQRMIQFFQQRGIRIDRLQLISWVDQAEHYRLLSSVDLSLDPFPYHGHTTSCQSIWMGVPMISRRGNSFRSRVGTSILHHLDLTDFIVDTDADYVQKAIAFATDLSRLRSLRPTLRQRLADSCMCDAVGFTRSVESAYRQMWQTACSR